MNHLRLSTNILHKVYCSLLKEQCYVCNIHSEGTLCRYCETHLTLNTNQCSKCARPMVSSVELCGQCQQKPPYFQHVIAPLVYEGLTRAMITKAKFEDQGHLFRPLTERLASALIDELDFTKDWHWSVVPTGKRSLIERGFCQTSLIRKLLKNPIKCITEQPFRTFDIAKSFERPTQHSLNKKERNHLSPKAFLIPQPAPQYVVLIDDLVTTGSTINACSKALLDAGVKEVIVAALARTPPQGSEYR